MKTKKSGRLDKLMLGAAMGKREAWPLWLLGCFFMIVVAWPALFSQSQASKSVFLFPEEHG